jgi:hypothetical protein
VVAVLRCCTVVGAQSRNSRSRTGPLKGAAHTIMEAVSCGQAPWCVGCLRMIFCCGQCDRASSRSRVLRHLEQCDGVDHRIFGESGSEEGISWQGMHQFQGAAPEFDEVSAHEESDTASFG